MKRLVQISSEVRTFLEEEQLLFINGEFVAAQSQRTFPVYNPATKELLAEVSEADEADIATAVAAAKKAFEDGPWHSMSAADRSRLMYRLSVLIQEHEQVIAEIDA